DYIGYMLMVFLEVDIGDGRVGKKVCAVLREFRDHFAWDYTEMVEYYCTNNHIEDSLLGEVVGSECLKVAMGEVDAKTAILGTSKGSWPFRGHQFVLVATNYFTKWTEVVPIKKYDT
ncbi:hypothetical protein ACJX0J_033553, partial [Zea mays]